MKKLILIATLSAVSGVWFGCASLPYKEKEAAYEAEEQARDAGAKKYAKGAYDAGTGKVKSADTFFNTYEGKTIEEKEKARGKKFDKKEREAMDVGFFNGKWAKAKEYYQAAVKDFKRAIDTALPKQGNDELDSGRDVKNELVANLKAANSVPREFKKAENEFEEARRAYRTKKSVENLRLLKKSVEHLKQVRDLAKKKQQAAEASLKKANEATKSAKEQK